MKQELDDDEIDFAAILKTTAQRDGQKLAGRRVADKKKLAATDRRAIRATGRVEQMNLRVRADFKAEVFRYAAQQGILPIEAIERAWAALQKLEGGEL